MPLPAPRTSMSYLVLSGSSRDGSYNTLLARLVAATIEGLGGQTEVITMVDVEMPLYSTDREAAGFPGIACRLRERLVQADGLVLVSPEFNASVPGPVKNVVDWLSRFRPQPFAEKQVLLLSASPSMVGGNRGLWALRIPLEHLGARVYPDMFSLAQAHHAFDGEGGLVDEVLATRLADVVGAFMALTEAATNYPITKHIWSEFPGEDSDDPTVARQE